MARGGFLEESLHLASDDEFFVSRNYEDFHAGVGGADDAFLRVSCIVLLGLQENSELVKLRADGCANSVAVLTDAGSEHEGIEAIKLQIKRADPMPRFVNEYVQRQLCFGIAL